MKKLLLLALGLLVLAVCVYAFSSLVSPTPTTVEPGKPAAVPAAAVTQNSEIAAVLPPALQVDTVPPTQPVSPNVIPKENTEKWAIEKGVVTDYAYGTPVAGVYFEVMGRPELTVFTDAKGYYELKVPAGVEIYTRVVGPLGYHTSSWHMELYQPGEIRDYKDFSTIKKMPPWTPEYEAAVEREWSRQKNEQYSDPNYGQELEKDIQNSQSIKPDSPESSFFMPGCNYPVPAQLFYCPNAANQCNCFNPVWAPTDEVVVRGTWAESGFTLQIEALKAQAIAWRTFGVFRNSPPNPRAANCEQVMFLGNYGLIPDYVKTAVAATNNMVLMGDDPSGTDYGVLIKNALYSARCNGNFTRNSEQGIFHTGGLCNEGGNYISYLRAVTCSGHSNCSQLTESPCCLTNNGQYIYGHGVGYCQRGGHGFAQNGMTFAEIIHHFYTDVCIANCGSCSGTVPCANSTLSLPSLSLTGSGCNTKLAAYPTGGQPPYTYKWNTGYTGQMFLVSSSGTYSVTIVDAQDCMVVGSRHVTITGTITAGYTVLKPASCNPKVYGRVQITPTGGGPYDYLWSDSVYSNSLRTNLHPGIYSVTVTSLTTGCTAVLSGISTFIAGWQPPSITCKPVVNVNLANGPITLSVFDVIESFGGSNVTVQILPNVVDCNTDSVTAIAMNCFGQSTSCVVPVVASGCCSIPMWLLQDTTIEHCKNLELSLYSIFPNCELSYNQAITDWADQYNQYNADNPDCAFIVTGAGMGPDPQDSTILYLWYSLTYTGAGYNYPTLNKFFTINLTDCGYFDWRAEMAATSTLPVCDAYTYMQQWAAPIVAQYNSNLPPGISELWYSGFTVTSIDTLPNGGYDATVQVNFQQGYCSGGRQAVTKHVIYPPGCDPLVGDQTDDRSSETSAEKSATKLQVFPNPADDWITVVVSGADDTGQGTICTVAGQVVAHFAIPDGQAQVDVSAVAPGLYVVRVGNEAIKIVIH